MVILICTSTCGRTKNQYTTKAFSIFAMKYLNMIKKYIFVGTISTGGNRGNFGREIYATQTDFSLVWRRISCRSAPSRREPLAVNDPNLLEMLIAAGGLVNDSSRRCLAFAEQSLFSLGQDSAEATSVTN